MIKKEYIGEAILMRGDALLLNTIGDEPLELTVKDYDLRWDMYCKCFKITVEEMSGEEIERKVSKTKGES